MKKAILIIGLIIFSVNSLAGQCISPTNFILQIDIQAPGSPLLGHDMTAKRDTAASKPYLYVAGKEQGLRIYNISNVNNPSLVFTIPTGSLGNLHAMNITQAGNYLYLALGDHFNATAQNSGMAIINISSPSAPVVSAVYSFTAKGGTAHVAVEGNYAYLSALQNGVLVLDISNKNNIVFVSQFKASVHFPKPNPNASEIAKINARQVAIRNNILYVCYDAGGVRIVNATNKNSLKETGKYSNPQLLARPRAMNNLILHDTLVYVAADYAGLEILNIKDTSNIKQVGWWNPWKAHLASNTWFNSPGHTNEIEFDPACKKVFMSAGRTDLIAVSVANPALPDSCADFGIKTNSDTLATWGLGHFGNQIYVAYFSTWPLYFPFTSKWAGIKIISYANNCITGINENLSNKNTMSIYPNPATNSFKLIGNKHFENLCLELYDFQGKLVKTCITDSNTETEISDLKPGLYFVRVKNKVLPALKLFKE